MKLKDLAKSQIAIVELPEGHVVVMDQDGQLQLIKLESTEALHEEDNGT